MKITIITATYNSAATLSDTMESVLRQTHHDIEHIIVDGCSTDGTLSIARSREPRYGGRLRIISEPDKGLYDAMNKGLRMATGDVVGLLNSDDFYTDDHALERIARAFADNEVDAVYGDVHYVHADNPQRSVRYYSSAIFRRSRMRMGFMPAHPTFYCRTAIYKQYGTFDTSYRVAADFEQLLRLIYVHRIRTQYLPYDFVTMRTGGVSTSGWKSHVRIMRDHRRALKANGVPSNILLLSLRYVYKATEVMAGLLHVGKNRRR